VKLTKEECISLLLAKAAEVERIPKKSDFLEYEVAAIKGYLGSWPRALETVGLKTAKLDDRKAKNRKKRDQTRQRRKMFKQNDVE
jgi:hypothetical protein